MATGHEDALPVTLFDYGVGNLHSIKKALEHAGAQVTVTRDANDLLKAHAIVLPGVGAFGASMKPLEPIKDRLRERLAQGTPCLAVCIGMQLLFDSSEETPDVDGIGLFKGKVRALPPTVGKIPHLGWNTVDGVQTHAAPPAQEAPTDEAWRNLVPPPGTYAYFVHSYHGVPEEPVTLASTHYGPDKKSIEIAAVVTKANTLATQFHPEKSSTPGLRLIKNWVEAARRATSTRAKTGTPTQNPASGPDGPEGKH